MPQTPYTANEPATRQRAQGLQKWPTVWLDACQARCVAEALVTAARKRGWRIYRAAVMANHVHVVIADCPNDGPLVRRILKGSSQAALSEALGRPHRWWTENGSDHYKNDWPAIDNADQYVARQQGILAEVVDMAVRVPQGGGRDKPGRS